MAICPECGHDNMTSYECDSCGWEFGFETHSTEPDVPSGDQCPHCKSTMTDDVATIWEDDDLICLANACYHCGQTFESIRLKL